MHPDVVIEHSVGVLVIADERIDLHHLAIDDPRPVTAGHTTKWEVRATRKGGIKNFIRQLRGADKKRFFHETRLRRIISRTRRAKKARMGLMSKTPPSGGRIRRKKLR
jgi:hypothetical protein